MLRRGCLSVDVLNKCHVGGVVSNKRGGDRVAHSRAGSKRRVFLVARVHVQNVLLCWLVLEHREILRSRGAKNNLSSAVRSAMGLKFFTLVTIDQWTKYCTAW